MTNLPRNVEFEYDTLMEILDSTYPFTSEHERYKVVKNDMIETTRWGMVYDLVFYDKKEGVYWKTSYEVGKTELQETMPFEYSSDRECTQVKPVEKTYIEYKPT